MKAFILGVLGLKAASNFKIDEGAVHEDRVHQQNNRQQVAMARFEIQRRASQRMTKRLTLGERLGEVLLEINEDAEKLRKALGDAMRNDH